MAFVTAFTQALSTGAQQCASKHLAILYAREESIRQQHILITSTAALRLAIALISFKSGSLLKFDVAVINLLTRFVNRFLYRSFQTSEDVAVTMYNAKKRIEICKQPLYNIHCHLDTLKGVPCHEIT